MDSLDLSEILNQVGYTGHKAFEDGFLILVQESSSVILYCDPTGNGKSAQKIVTITGVNLHNLSAETFNQSGDIKFVYQTLSAEPLSEISFNKNSVINGTVRSETLTGTSGDDVIDSAGGDDIIDGGGGTDTLLIYEPASDFTVSTLGGITKIVGSWKAGNYAYDEITLKNVEKVQFSDNNKELQTLDNVHLVSDDIESWKGNDTDEIIHSLNSSATIDGSKGNDKYVVFSNSDEYSIKKLSDSSTQLTLKNDYDRYSEGSLTLKNTEEIIFLDTSIDISHREVKFEFSDNNLVEGGASVNKVKLNPNPAVEVSKSSFFFNSTDWASPQTFSIRAPENSIIDGFEKINLGGEVLSPDEDYGKLQFPDIKFSYVDNDIPTTGELKGTVWFDSNKNGTKDTGEIVSDLGVVFLDLNRNGVRELEEPSHDINANSFYSFVNLRPGTYFVGLDLPTCKTITFPNGTTENMVILQA